MVPLARSAEDQSLAEWPLAYTLEDLRQVKDLYRDIHRKPHLERYVRNLVDHCVRHAGDEKPWTRSCLHRCLAEIYAAHFIPGSAAPDIEFDPFMVEVQRQLEDAWMSYEDARVDLGDVPSDASEFVEWLRWLVMEEHPANGHALFDFLRKTANRYELATSSRTKRHWMPGSTTSSRWRRSDFRTNPSSNWPATTGTKWATASST